MARSSPRPGSPTSIDDGVARALDARYDVWQQKIALKWARLLELEAAGRLPFPVVQIASTARELATDAEKLHGQGQSAAAYSRITAAWVYVVSATAIADIVNDYRAGNFDGATAKLSDLDGQLTATDSTVRTIAAVQPDSIAAHLRVIAAFQGAVLSWGFDQVATEAVASARSLITQAATSNLPATTFQSDAVVLSLGSAVTSAVLAINRSVAAGAVALEGLDLHNSSDVPYQAAVPSIKQLATGFRAAATANLATMKTFALDKSTAPYVEQAPDDAAAALALRDEWGEGCAAGPLASLAASELAWFRTSVSIAKSYSLGVVIIRKPTALTEEEFQIMKTHPIKGAAIMAAIPQLADVIPGMKYHHEKYSGGGYPEGLKGEEIPLQARIAYQTARALRDGGVADRMSALEAFWLASLYSQTAQMLARN